MTSKIKKLEELLTEKTDDLFREKAKIARVKEKLKIFERKYYNIDIDLLH